MKATNDKKDTGRTPLRILVVDDHAFFRRGLREMLNEEQDIEVVAEAADGEEAIRRVRLLWPHGVDVVLMDVDMPKMDGITATRRIVAEYPGLPVVILTVSALDRDLFETARAGAVGFLSKNLSPAALARALHDFHRDGSLPMSPVMASRVLAHFQQMITSAAQPAGERHNADQDGRTEALEDRLTPREREVLGLLAQGSRDREIAQQLVLTEHTVKKHVQKILSKMGARSRVEAVTRFLRRA